MPPIERKRGGAVAWACRWWRALLAELVATALLVALGVATVMPVRGADSVQLAHPALAFGFLVTANALAFGPVSGAHMNPAVTLAALVHGRIAPVLAAAYVVVQALGALLGFGALLAMTPAHAAGLAAGCTLPGPSVTPVAAAAFEALLTGVLALACCAVWEAHDDARPDATVPIKLGLVVAGLVFSGGHATGASLNPARSLAPALLHAHWQHHWVYWVGPMGGAALAALLHRGVLAGGAHRARAPAPPELEACAPEALPLNDKP